MTRIIALTSVRGRSGKDTLIEQLKARGLEVARVAFGDILKEECAKELQSWKVPFETLVQWFHSDTKDQLLGDLAISQIPDGPYRQWLMFTADRNEDPKWMESPRSPRWHLQKYGTDYRRNHLANPNVWLNAGLENIEGLALAGAKLIVVTDLRQRNEYQALADLSGVLWTSPAGSAKVDAVKAVRMQRLWFVPGVDDAEYHVTDLDLIGFYMNAVVLNQWGHPDAMVEQLYQQGVLPR
ncbi:hypothetical protein X917_gp16 [Pseudomonas phage PPpW-4]|uniref:Deoxynucleotide monophosphate kinase n=1 Tax=Pseudomonas phage PPpW-4 TaxID=1279083 RepID=V5YTH2_9CAUD|nr:hypothetical protein X917_gp16 [Pseudomonas phage PPpW-4]BAO20682.1 hypothetical protein [Pseudomonas phage PPpW-4]